MAMSAADDPKRDAARDVEGDAELLRRLGSDPAALEAFYRRHVAAVAAFVARRVRDADAVADVVSNTFLAAIRGAEGFDPGRSPDSARFWMLGIARREIAEHHSSAGRQDALARRARGRRQLSDDETARIDELIDAQRLAPEIQVALDELSPAVRDAFVLVAVDGVPQTAAAGVLGISHVALRARLTRARLHLRRRLQGVGTTTADSTADATADAIDPTSLDSTALVTAPVPGGTHGL
jgi:RNA polymerase sigma factor (sigma-70 family)